MSQIISLVSEHGQQLQAGLSDLRQAGEYFCALHAPRDEYLLHFITGALGFTAGYLWHWSLRKS
jgi:hypothetical protein